MENLVEVKLVIKNLDEFKQLVEKLHEDIKELSEFEPKLILVDQKSSI